MGLLRKKYCIYLSVLSMLSIFVIAASIVTSLVSSGTIHYYLGGWEPPWGIEYVIDPLSSFMVILITFISLIIVVYSRRSVEKELPNNEVAFYTLFMLLITGLLGIVVTGDLFNLYVFLEIASLTAYALIAVGEKRDALVASFNYLIIGTIAACFILLGIGFLYMVTGSLNMADVSTRLPEAYGQYPKVVLAALAFFVVGLSIKVALFPLHLWLPNAYTHAPSTVSALLAALMTKVGAYVMIRIIFTVFGFSFITQITDIAPLMDILSIVGALAIIVGAVFAISQTDIKRMLAYSSVSQIGYIVLGIGLSNPIGLTGGILHILHHAFMKGCLFLAVGAIIYRTGIRDIFDFQGIGRKMPYTMLAFSIAALSMVGIPPLCGFFSKWFLVLGAIESKSWKVFFSLVILSSSLLNAGYFFRILERTWFGESPYSQRDEAPISMLLPTLTLAAGCILLGVLIFVSHPFIVSIVDTLF
ncbi:MAG: monovalent cation/H+ antiporter subunit D family protein [Candidatus Altiarchaeota archaeon]|nr:monovalent cation/H+ antiporter subunit D family protein [Candidatus Altiarchaeota archaeon]